MAHIRGLVVVVAAQVAVGEAVHAVVGGVVLAAVEHVQLVQAVVPLRDRRYPSSVNRARIVTLSSSMVMDGCLRINEFRLFLSDA